MELYLTAIAVCHCRETGLIFRDLNCNYQFSMSGWTSDGLSQIMMKKL